MVVPIEHRVVAGRRALRTVPSLGATKSVLLRATAAICLVSSLACSSGTTSPTTIPISTKTIPHWGGVTSQGTTISFDGSSVQISRLDFELRAAYDPLGPCNIGVVVTVGTIHVTANPAARTFTASGSSSLDQATWSVLGTFTSDTEARGSISFRETPPGCQPASADVDWTATRQN